MIAALAPALVLAAALGEGPVIEINGANFRPMPLAVVAPIVQDGTPKGPVAEFDDSLTFDLSAAGIFQMLDRKSFLSDTKEGITAGSINFSHWSDVGAEALVKTQVALAGDVLRADLRLFTVSTGKEELKVSHEVPVKDARRLAHFLADAVYKFFTHESGPFETHITYSRKGGANKDVWFADWDGHHATQLTNGGLNLLPAMGRDGSTVGYTSYRSGKPEIYVQHPGGEAKELVKAGQMATGIAFSPDGKRIAYSVAAGESAQIWVANADGSSAKALTDTSFFINTSPAWSPDGRQLAFVSNRGGTPQIYVMGGDGSNPRRITFQGNYNQTPDWSPRGDLIAFTARDERRAFDLFTVNVETGKVTRLTQDQGMNQEPAFSPNGRLIMFMSDRVGGVWRLYVMTFDGNDQLPLPLDKAEYSTPSWGP